MNYQIIASEHTINNFQDYWTKAQYSLAHCGARFRAEIVQQKASNDWRAGLECLLNTKEPQFFAESALYGDGRDWNQTELSILGDISIGVPITVFDDARHYDPDVHAIPFAAELVYTPGALLRNDRGFTPADWEAVITNDQFDSVKFTQLYKRRLIPVFKYIQQRAAQLDKKAIVTIPGLGCGQFSGPFSGELGQRIENVLATILQTLSSELSQIELVYFDPFSECSAKTQHFGAVQLRTRPLLNSYDPRSQLCHPVQFEEEIDDFSQHHLFSLVAWDHVSWPGNDFFGGARATDDGVKAAATDSMLQLTGYKGEYCALRNEYRPSSKYETWGDLVEQYSLRLFVKNLKMYSIS
ncbi:MAG: hypothetical protein COA47_15915 [Robiginitomaculum sp.]|nr:MAG: hypothetical protein COA47_15915 [Robiginitomaculum sp.]